MATDAHLTLDPSDEHPHVPEPVPTYNESMYFNAFDFGREVGGWFRLGNRVNEGYAEMSVCLYLDGGRVGFMYARPSIDTNERMDAGGLRIDVLDPFERLRVRYQGTVCLLDEPAQMADPRRAFTANPHVACEVDLEFGAVSDVFGGRLDGRATDADRSFAKAHYEQHMAAAGIIRVDDEVIDLDGYGLRDKSWGPRTWQAIDWYRWLPISFGPDFGMTISLRGQGDTVLPGVGMVHHDGRYTAFGDADIRTERDDDGYQRTLVATASTAERTYEVRGEVLSLIPLRNRRAGPDGELRVTRITEGFTRYHCDGRTGYGMSEYLDQLAGGQPVGLGGA